VNICLIVIQHRERLGCGNTESGSAWLRRGCLHLCRPCLLSSVHWSRPATTGKQLSGQSPTPRRRKSGSCERLLAAVLEPCCSWRGPFLPGSSPPGCARIAITPAIVRPVRGAAIVEVGGDRLDVILRSMLNRCGRSMMGKVVY